MKQRFQVDSATDVFIPGNTVVTDPSGRRYLMTDLLDDSKKKKRLAPKIIAKRKGELKIYHGKQRDIRHSPWRMQLICRHVTGMTVPDAITQLEFLNKRMAPLVLRIIQRTSNLADIRHATAPSQLQVAKCFTTQGSHLKRMKFHGRGRHGVMHHKFCHVNVVLREIDFPFELYMARTSNAKQKWMERYADAQRDAEQARTKREELESLERIVALKNKK